MPDHGELLQRAHDGDVEAMLAIAEDGGPAEQARWLLQAAQAGSNEGVMRLSSVKASLEQAA